MSGRYERRERLWWVSEHDVFDLVAGALRPARFLCLPVLEGIPRGADLVLVRHCWREKAFAFTFRHPSFPDVPDGEPTPWAGPLEYRTVEVALAGEPAEVEHG